MAHCLEESTSKSYGPAPSQNDVASFSFANVKLAGRKLIGQKSTAWVSLLVAGTLVATAVTSARADVELVGSYDNGFYDYTDVWGYDDPGGTALAIVGLERGDLFLNVTDPANPTPVTLFPGTQCGWRDVKTAGHYAYIVNDCESDDCLRIYDLSDPLNPTLAYSGSDLFRRSHNVFLDGNVLYSVGTDVGLVLVDVSDPTHPTEIATYPDLPYLHDIYVRDGVGYASAYFENELILYDVSDPSDVQEFSSLTYPGAATHNAWLTDSGTYCITTDEVPRGHLNAFDVSDPEKPVRISEFVNLEDPESIVHNVAVVGDLAYASWYTNGLLVVSFESPGLPQEVGRFDTSEAAGTGFDGAWGVYPYAASGLTYVSDRQSGFFIVRYFPTHGEWKFQARRSDTAASLDGVEVSFPDLQLSSSTAAGESATYLLQPGTHHYEANLFGYEPQSGTIEATTGATETIILDLVPYPAGSVVGTVSAAGAALEQGRVSIDATPLENRLDEAGSFSFPSVPAGTYELRAEIFGYGRDVVELTVSAGAESLTMLELEPSAYAADFEVDDGWTVGLATDDATAGIWERVDPVGTGFDPEAQSEDDASPFGTMAYVTGNTEPGGSVGEADIDGGVTTLVSPLIPLLGLETPVLQFKRWFYSSVGPGSGDFLEVTGSADGGGTWVALSRVESSESEWVRVEIPLQLYFRDPESIQLRFTAADQGQRTVVEAGLDDVEVFDAKSTIVLEHQGPFSILDPWPHPLRGQGLLRFSMAGPTEVRLDLYDVSGRRIRQIGSRLLPGGTSTMEFDGRNDAGEKIHSGVYFLRVESAEGTTSRAIRLVR